MLTRARKGLVQLVIGQRFHDALTGSLSCFIAVSASARVHRARSPERALYRSGVHRVRGDRLMAIDLHYAN